MYVKKITGYNNRLTYVILFKQKKTSVQKYIIQKCFLLQNIDIKHYCPLKCANAGLIKMSVDLQDH